MSYSLQPISSMPFPAPMGANGFTPSGLQQALSMNPSLGVEAANKTMMGPMTGLNPLNPAGADLNPLNPVFTPLNGTKVHSDAELKHVSQKFEAVLLQLMFKQMRESVHKSPLFGNSQAMQFFETMQDEQMSDHLAAAGGIGLGNVIYQRLKQVTAPHVKSF